VTTTAPPGAAALRRADRRADRGARLEQAPAPSRRRVVLVLGALIALGPATIDMYLPALPTLGEDLAATPAQVQLTLTGTLVGLGLGQLVLGPVSDAVGRRLPVLVGTAVHVVASLLCMVAPNVAVLGGLRLVQGLSAAAAAVVATAVVRDLYSGNTAAVVLSRLMLVLGVAPVLAPTVGGELLRLTDWRGVFGALAVLGALLLLMAATSLPETLPPSRRRTGGVVGTARAYRGLLRDRSYVGLVLVAGTAMAALFAYVSGSAFVLQDQYGLTEQQFGLVFGAGAVFLIAATQLNVRLLDRTGPAQIMTGGLVVGVLASAALLVVAATGGGLVPLLAALWTVLAAVGLVMPNAPALALARHARAAGTAAALLGALQFGVGAVAAPLVGVLGTDATAMGLVMLGGMVTALALLLLVVRPVRRGVWISA
jgi:DHA1 family bicyclomycin/chloramphenicol resistance-like MFS transporter